MVAVMYNSSLEQTINAEFYLRFHLFKRRIVLKVADKVEEMKQFKRIE